MNKAADQDHYDLGVELASQQRYLEAISAFNNALQADINHVEAFLGRALCYRELGNRKMAIDSLKSAAYLGSQEAKEELRRLSVMETPVKKKRRKRGPGKLTLFWEKYQLPITLGLVLLFAASVFFCIKMLEFNSVSKAMTSSNHNSVLTSVNKITDPVKLEQACDRIKKTAESFAVNRDKPYSPEDMNTSLEWNAVERHCRDRLKRLKK